MTMERGDPERQRRLGERTPGPPSCRNFGGPSVSSPGSTPALMTARWSRLSARCGNFRPALDHSQAAAGGWTFSGHGRRADVFSTAPMRVWPRRTAGTIRSSEKMRSRPVEALPSATVDFEAIRPILLLRACRTCRATHWRARPIMSG
jgi:hypothetical protein